MSNKPTTWKEKVLTCKKCEFLTADSICSKCGCVVFIKAVIPTAKCPISKW